MSSVLRRARRHRLCDSHDCAIGRGDYYLVHVEFPGGESGFADAAGQPVRMAECRVCAERYGRGDLFPVEVEA